MVKFERTANQQSSVGERHRLQMTLVGMSWSSGFSLRRLTLMIAVLVHTTQNQLGPQPQPPQAKA